MISKVLFSCESDDWATPPDLFAYLDNIFDFQLDAAASPHNTKCSSFFSVSDNGLAQDWHPFRRIWLNPPYGAALFPWTRKAWEEAEKGCLVVARVPARTDTKWWHENVVGKARISFLRRRLRFRNPLKNRDGRGSCVFPAALLVYGINFDEILNSETHLHLGRSASSWSGFT